MKGLKIKDEGETPDSDKSWNESKEADLVQDSEKLDQLKGNRMRRQ